MNSNNKKSIPVFVKSLVLLIAILSVPALIYLIYTGSGLGTIQTISFVGFATVALKYAFLDS